MFSLSSCSVTLALLVLSPIFLQHVAVWSVIKLPSAEFMQMQSFGLRVQPHAANAPLARARDVMTADAFIVGKFGWNKCG